MTQEPVQTAAQTYEEYLVPGVHARWAPVLVKHARPRRGESVLDVACGTGIVARTIASHLGRDGTVVAVDASPDMLEVGRSLPPPEGAGIDWRHGDASSLPDGPFDLVTCQQGLQFFPDRSAAVAEMRRVLSPGGRVAINVFDGLERQGLYGSLFRATARHLGKPVEAVATPFSLGDENQLRVLLSTAGFREIEVISESVEVSFPEPERFLSLTVLAAAAVVPDMGTDAQARAALVEGVQQDVAKSFDQYVEGDRVSFPMFSYIATAQR